MRERIGKLIVGPTFDPNKAWLDQALETWKGATKPTKVELTAEEKAKLSQEELETLSLEEAKKLAHERLQAPKNPISGSKYESGKIAIEQT